MDAIYSHCLNLWKITDICISLLKSWCWSCSYRKCWTWGPASMSGPCCYLGNDLVKSRWVTAAQNTGPSSPRVECILSLLEDLLCMRRLVCTVQVHGFWGDEKTAKVRTKSPFLWFVPQKEPHHGGRAGLSNWVGWWSLLCAHVLLIDYIVLDLCIKNTIPTSKASLCHFVAV